MTFLNCNMRRLMCACNCRVCPSLPPVIGATPPYLRSYPIYTWDPMPKIYAGSDAQYIRWIRCPVYTLDPMPNIYVGPDPQCIRWTRCPIYTLDPDPMRIIFSKYLLGAYIFVRYLSPAGLFSESENLGVPDAI